MVAGGSLRPYRGGIKPAPIRGTILSSATGEAPNAPTISNPIMVATLSRYELSWDCYSQWMPKDDNIGGIYSNYVHFHSVDDYKFEVSFRIGENRQLGLLFAEVNVTGPGGYLTKSHYCLGQFYTNKGAKLFAQFALNHFIETETWSVCPSFKCVDYINGEPCDLGGEEILSELI